MQTAEREGTRPETSTATAAPETDNREWLTAERQCPRGDWSRHDPTGLQSQRAQAHPRWRRHERSDQDEKGVG
jgi:hypothetical protein